MPQENVVEAVVINIGLVTCPHCGLDLHVDLADFTEANSYVEKYRCSDCGNGFKAEFKGLTRPPEQRNDAETPIPAAFEYKWHCSACGEWHTEKEFTCPNPPLP